MSAFLLDAGWTVLNQLCDSLISAPSGGRVRFTPLAPLIVMSFTDFPSATFVDFPNRGSASERELSFGLPGLYSVYDQGGALVETAFALFMPFLFLGNPVAMLTGRESYGYFKQQGRDRPADRRRQRRILGEGLWLQDVLVLPLGSGDACDPGTRGRAARERPRPALARSQRGRGRGRGADPERARRRGSLGGRLRQLLARKDAADSF